MQRLLFVLTFAVLISACGSADDYFEEQNKVILVDSIFVSPPDSSDNHKKDPNDNTTTGNDSTIISKDSINTDSLKIVNRPEIEYTSLFRLSSISKNEQQGFAIYDKYLFNCHHSNDIIDVFDLETQKKIASISLEPETIVHCNNVNFGPEFYDNKDRFPLLYVQQRGYACKLNVYRIICDGDDIVTAKKVQTISFESCSSCINTIDNDKHLLYAIYRSNGTGYISSFKLPSVKDGNISIHPKTALKTYYSPYNKIGQDTAFGNNYLYLLCGYSREGELWRIDIDNRNARVIDFPKYGLTGEPEGIDLFKGNIMVSFLNTTIYNIKIVD